MAAAVVDSPSLRRMLAAETSRPARAERAYAASKHAQALANPSFALASLPLLTNVITWVARWRRSESVKAS